MWNTARMGEVLSIDQACQPDIESPYGLLVIQELITHVACSATSLGLLG